MARVVEHRRDGVARGARRHEVGGPGGRLGGADEVQGVEDADEGEDRGAAAATSVVVVVVVVVVVEPVARQAREGAGMREGDEGAEGGGEGRGVIIVIVVDDRGGRSGRDGGDGRQQLVRGADVEFAPDDDAARDALEGVDAAAQPHEFAQAGEVRDGGFLFAEDGLGARAC